MLQNNYCQQSHGRIINEWKNEELWSSKLEEIRQFQREGQEQQISVHQAEDLVNIYNKYRHIFSDVPDKVKDYQLSLIHIWSTGKKPNNRSLKPMRD